MARSAARREAGKGRKGRRMGARGRIEKNTYIR